jgi:hypothetical protein
MHKPVVLLAARQKDTVTNPVPAVVSFHESGKFVVHFDCELPDLPTVQVTGQIMLEKN